MVSKKAIYTGRVQGVGFRMTAQHLAAGLRVGGYVKNLPSGQVEVAAEGEADQVDELFTRIARKMAGYIQDVQTTEQEPQGFAQFQIRY